MCKMHNAVIFEGKKINVFPQTVLALRGSHGVAKEGAMVGLRNRAWTRSLICVAIYNTW